MKVYKNVDEIRGKVSKISGKIIQKFLKNWSILNILLKFQKNLSFLENFMYGALQMYKDTPFKTEIPI